MNAPESGQPGTALHLPQNHPARIALNDEVHARPPEALTPPSAISFLALALPGSAKDAAWRQICDLARRFGVPEPEADASHFSAALGPFRVKWERHSEFVRYKFIVEACASFNEPAIAKVPGDWLQGLTGQTLVATNILLLSGGQAAPIRTGSPPNISAAKPWLALRWPAAMHGLSRISGCAPMASGASWCKICS